MRSFAVTLRSPMTATRKFEIVGKWRFLCYEHVTRVLIRVKGAYFACFWHRSNGIYVDFVESHIVRLSYPLTGFCIVRIMRAFPWSGSRSNVHDLRPLRSFLSVLSPASGRESAYPDGRGRGHAGSTVGIERSEDGTFPTRVKRRCAIRILSCSLRVLPAPVIRQRPYGGRHRPSNGAPTERFIAVSRPFSWFFCDDMASLSENRREHPPPTPLTALPIPTGNPTPIRVSA